MSVSMVPLLDRKERLKINKKKIKKKVRGNSKPLPAWGLRAHLYLTWTFTWCVCNEDWKAGVAWWPRLLVVTRRKRMDGKLHVTVPPVKTLSPRNPQEWRMICRWNVQTGLNRINVPTLLTNTSNVCQNVILPQVQRSSIWSFQKLFSSNASPR